MGHLKHSLGNITELVASQAYVYQIPVLILYCDCTTKYVHAHTHRSPAAHGGWDGRALLLVESYKIRLLPQSRWNMAVAWFIWLAVEGRELQHES